jgi:hypothetical protein
MVGWGARSQVALAEVLLSADGEDDRDRAATLLREASGVARDTGMLPSSTKPPGGPPLRLAVPSLTTQARIRWPPRKHG